MANRSLSSLHPAPTAAARKRGLARSRRGALAAAIEALESRVLLTGTYTAGLLSGALNLYGMDKNGSLTFDGTSAITAGTWNNQSGPPATTIISPSNYSVSSTGQVSLLLTGQPANNTASSTTSVTLGGVMNGTRDVVALNETSGGTPVANGLDVLVATGGTYTTSLLAGTWNIAAQDFRGSITVNAAGVITAGTLYNESNQNVTSVVSGTATLSTSGTGSISLTTALSATSSLHTIALTFSMNAAHDTMVANSQNLGNGTASAELTMLVKNSGTYALSDVVGTTGLTWTLNSALGEGSLTFLPNKTISGSYTNTSGALVDITGNYVLGGNGTVTVNVTATSSSASTIHESFTGVLNQHKNLIVLDRAIANGDLSSSLMILTNPADHAPTESAKATWPVSAYETSALTFDYNTLVSSTVGNVVDLDKDTLSLQVTPVNGALTLLNGTVSTVITSSATMTQGETLLWTPAATSGLIEAFTIQASDGTLSAANATKIFVNTGPLPVVSAIATKGNALSAKAGSASSYGTIVLQRVGGQVSSALTVTVQVGGTAVLNTNYTLVGPNGSFSATTATVTFQANENTVTLDVEPNLDPTVTTNKTITVTVRPDPNSTSPAYAPSVHPTATVNELTSNPSIVIVPVVQKIKDGGTHELAFYVERTPAQGGSLANLDNTVTITYSGTQNAYTGSLNVANDLTPGTASNLTTVTFTSDQVKKVIFLSPGDDGVAATEQLTATISDGSTSSFFAIPSGSASATISVTDDAPTVHVKTLIATGSEASPQTSFGEFQIIRTGSTDSALTVDIATSGAAVQGTSGNYTLVSAANTSQTFTSTVTIPAGASSFNVELLPIDDGLNDGNLKATITLVPDATPSYHVGSADKSVITILNHNRFPTIGNATSNATTSENTAILITASSLPTDTDAALASGSNGTLEFEVGKVLSGSLNVENGTSGTFTTIGAHAIITAGETLKWKPPTGLTGTTADAFTLFALDGNLESTSSTLFTVTIS